MSVERIEIDSDEGGFMLILDGDFTVECENHLSGRMEGALYFRLPDDQAVALMEEVKQKIRPWHVEGESVRHDHERYRRTGELPDYISEDRLNVPPGAEAQEGEPSGSPSALGEHLAEARAVEQHQEEKHGERLLERVDYERKRDRENR